jgi:hypothetical protein
MRFEWFQSDDFLAKKKSCENKTTKINVRE